MNLPVEVAMNGKLYRILSLVETGGMSISGDGESEIDYLCRAEWLSPFGWKKLRNVNLLAELRQQYDKVLADAEKEGD